MRNDSARPIFVSYAPESDRAASFLTYSLLRRSAQDSDFKEYGEAFHHVPNLHPINARSAMTFHLINYPSEEGEYKVWIGYFDDEEIYKLVSERLIEMTEVERDRVARASKHVLSESFKVSHSSPSSPKR